MYLSNNLKKGLHKKHNLALDRNYTYAIGL